MSNSLTGTDLQNMMRKRCSQSPVIVTLGNGQPQLELDDAFQLDPDNYGPWVLVAGGAANILENANSWAGWAIDEMAKMRDRIFRLEDDIDEANARLTRQQTEIGRLTWQVRDSGVKANVPTAGSEIPSWIKNMSVSELRSEAVAQYRAINNLTSTILKQKDHIKQLECDLMVAKDKIMRARSWLND